MARITPERLEKRKRLLLEAERAFKQQERKDDTRKKILLGSLVILAIKNDGGSGAVKMVEYLAQQDGVSLRDVRFLAEVLDEPFSEIFGKASETSEALSGKQGEAADELRGDEASKAEVVPIDKGDLQIVSASDLSSMGLPVNDGFWIAPANFDQFVEEWNEAESDEAVAAPQEAAGAVEGASDQEKATDEVR